MAEVAAIDTAASPPPPFDPELAGPLRQIQARLPFPLTADLIPGSRAQAAGSMLSDDDIRGRWPYDVEERWVPAATGQPRVRLIICRPTAVAPPWPVIYNAHGGGMVSGTHRGADLIDELARALQVGAAVVAAAYRLAPEHPDPAPVEDCYAGLAWVAANAGALGCDPERIVVSGNSAGGGLAAGVALLARDRGGPRLCGQLLQCPMLDDRCGTGSARQMVRIGLWDSLSNLTGWAALLGDRRGTEDVSCYAAPARATDLSGLPPAYIDVGSVEALRDEAVDYAGRIWGAGGEAELHVWSGAFHSFDWWVPGAAVSRTAMEARVAWLRRLLTRVDATRPTPAAVGDTFGQEPSGSSDLRHNGR